MINWNHGCGFKRYSSDDFENGLIPKIEKDSREWVSIYDRMSPFGISGYTSKYLCEKCKKTGEGLMSIGQKYKRGIGEVRYVYMNMCFGCAIPLCKFPNEEVSYMLNRIDKQSSGLLSGEIWTESYSRKSEWVNIEGGFYNVGPYKGSSKLFWARNPSGFLPHKFPTLIHAKAAVMKETMEAIPIYRKKIVALYDPTSTQPKSEEEELYLYNDL